MADAGNAVTEVHVNQQAGGLKIDGIRVVGTQHTDITDAVVAHNIVDAAGDFAADLETELEGFLNALSVKVNAIIKVMTDHGLIG